MQFMPSTALSSRAADYARTQHHIDAPKGVLLEDLTRPSFWTHHAPRLNARDLIDVVAEDGSFDVTLRVMKSEKTGVEVRLLRIWQDKSVAVEEPTTNDGPAPIEEPENIVPGFKINFAPKTRWRVIRLIDKMELKRDLMSRDAAIEWAQANTDKAV